MAKKLDMESMLKYLVMAAGALFVPNLINMVPQITSFIAGIPFVGQALYGGVTVLDLALAGVGIGLIDQMFY